MIKQLAWNTFKNTGNINTFLELVEFDKIENNIENKEKKAEENGDYKDERNYITRK